MIHVCTPENCPEPGFYYVTCVDGPHLWKMSGPYRSHAAALADQDKVLKIADKHDPRAWFMWWGTARFKDGAEQGRLNKFGLLQINS